MTFSEFAHTLEPIIGGGSNTVVFTRKLFSIMVGEDKQDIIERLSDDSYKAYYNGNTSISGIAKKILPYADPENFVAYLNNFEDAVTEKLFNAFSNKIDGITSHNTSEKIAYCFDEIINAATLTQRKSPSKKDEPINIPPEQAVLEFPYVETDKELLTEFNFDYNEIMLTLISGDYTTHLIDMSLPNKIKELYQAKWKDKSNDFIDPTLKSYVYGLIGVLNELSNSFISCNSNTTFIKNQRLKIRNFYIKLHPETYDKFFPYDLIIDDWNDGEF